MRAVICYMAILFVTVCFPVHGQDATGQIEMHREWMKQHTRITFDDDAALLVAAADAVASLAHEPENITIIASAGELVPVLKDYAVFKRQNKLDIGDKFKIRALAGITAVVRDRFKHRPEMLSRCLYDQACVSINVDDKYSLSLLEEACILQREIVATHPAALLTEELYLYELTRLYAFGIVEGDNPLHFKEVFSLERKILDFYKTHPESISQSEIYSLLAVIKGNTSFISDSNSDYCDLLLCKGYDYPVYSEEDLRTGFISNGMYYYREAIVISERVRGKYHPDGVYTKLNGIYRRISTDDFSVLDAECDSLYRYAEKYFPLGSPVTIDIKMAQWQLYSFHEKKMYETASYLSIQDRYKSYYGEQSKTYAGFMQQLAYIRMNADFAHNGNASGSQALVDEYNRLSRGVYGESGAYLLPQMDFLYLYRLYDAKKYNIKVHELIEIYTDAPLTRDWRKVLFGVEFGRELFENGLYGEAVQVQKQLLNDIEFLCATSTIFYAQQVFDYASYLEGNRQISDAELYFRKTIDMMKKHSKLNIAVPCIRYGELLHTIKKYNDCEQVLMEAVNDDKTKQDTLNYAYVLLSLGSLYLIEQDVPKDRIQKVFEEAIPLFNSCQDKLTSETVRGNLDIASYYKYIQKTDSVEKYYLKGIGMYEDLSLPYDYTFMEFANNLVGFYLQTGKDYKAEQFTERNINNLRETGGTNSTEYLEFLWNRVVITQWRTPNDYVKLTQSILASLKPTIEIYYQTGESLEIKYSYILRAYCFLVHATTRIVTDPIPEDIPEANRKDYDDMAAQCKAQLEEAVQNLLEIEKEFPEFSKPFDYRQHSYYKLLVQTLGKYYERVKLDYAKSEHYYLLEKEANDLSKGSDSSSSLRSLVQLYEAKSDWEKALYYNTQCYEALETFSVYEKLQILRHQAQLHYMLGKYKEAVPPALKLGEHMKQFVMDNFDFMSSNERGNFLDEYGNSGNLINLLLDKEPSLMSAPAYDAVLFDKGLLLHSWERIRKSIINSGNDELIACMDTLNLLNSRWKSIHVSKENLNQSATDVYTLQEKIEQLEKRLSMETQEFRDKKMKKVTWKDVQSKLHENEAAIEYLLTDTTLTALIVRKESKIPQYVCLGDAMRPFELLNKTQTLPADTKAKRLYTFGRSNLYELLWKPITPYLEGINTVYFSPVAFLHYISFPAIPVTPDSCLMDRYNLHQLTTTAELLREPQQKKMKSAELFGGIYYSDSHTPETNVTGMLKQRAAIEEEFPYLSETASEVDSIGKYMKNEGVSIRELKGADATEQAFYALDNNSPGIIHLATHGFYISGKENIERNKFLAKYPNAKYKSMQRTGLAFAGANATWQGEVKPDKEDGILTSNELSLLNLEQTDLVVLSACETGLGEVNSEGVWGLQRGFKEAGVHSMIISLWNVNDKAASAFMQIFYKNWLDGVDKYDAFNRAIKEIRAKYPDPFYWASFVLLDGIN